MRLAALILCFWLVYAVPARADEFVAFSLGAARRQVESSGAGDWRSDQRDLFTLGGMTRIRGLVIDPDSRDIILVGLRDPSRPPLTLDDLAVALRARLLRGEWPLVSIDPTDQTAATGMQRVRYEGGIEDTAFGADLFEADLRLKEINQGSIPSGDPAVRGTFDLRKEDVLRQRSVESRQVRSRFWFYPTLSAVLVRDNVAAIDGLKVAVFTEVLSAIIDEKPVGDVQGFIDPLSDRFARDVTDHYAGVAAAHPSIARLPGLLELIAVAHAARQLQPEPDLSYWVTAYPVKAVETPREQAVIRKRWDYAEHGVKGWLTSEGGVRLTALAVRLDGGDVTALREAVLNTRPPAAPLQWSFVVGQWVIATTPGATPANFSALCAQASYLIDCRRYRDAIAIYNRILELKEDIAGVWYARAVTYTLVGEYQHSIADCNRALALAPRDANVLVTRANAHAELKEFERASTDYDAAITANPLLAVAWSSRGCLRAESGEFRLAAADFEKAIELRPAVAGYWSNRGGARLHLGEYDAAIADCERALGLDPDDMGALINRGHVFRAQRRYDRAIIEYCRALRVNPHCVAALQGRAKAHALNGERALAIADFGKILTLDPEHKATYVDRAEVYHQRGEVARAIADLEQAVRLDPLNDRALNNLGCALMAHDEDARAVGYFERCIAIDPEDSVAWRNKAKACHRLGRNAEAIEAYERVLALAGPDDTEGVEQARRAVAKLRAR